jgi:hypothetical protein
VTSHRAMSYPPSHMAGEGRGGGTAEARPPTSIRPNKEGRDRGTGLPREQLYDDGRHADDRIKLRYFCQPAHIDAADQQPGGFALAGLDQAEILQGVKSLG